MSCRFADRYGRKTRLVVEDALHPRPQAMLFPLPDSGSGPRNVVCLPNDAQRQMLEEAPCSLQRNMGRKSATSRSLLQPFHTG